MKLLRKTKEEESKELRERREIWSPHEFNGHDVSAVSEPFVPVAGEWSCILLVT